MMTKAASLEIARTNRDRGITMVLSWESPVRGATAGRGTEWARRASEEAKSPVLSRLRDAGMLVDDLVGEWTATVTATTADWRAQEGFLRDRTDVTVSSKGLVATTRVDAGTRP